MYIPCPFQYKRVTAKDLFSRSLTPMGSQPLFVDDYFQNQELVDLMNKFKKLNLKNSALAKNPLFSNALNLELEFHKAQKDSYLFIFLPQTPKRPTRRKSAPELNPPKRPRSKKSLVCDIPVSSQSVIKEAMNPLRKPQRFNSSLDGEEKDLAFDLSGFVDFIKSPNTLRKKLSGGRRRRHFQGNFIQLEILLNFIFLKEDDLETMQLEFSLLEKLKRVLLVCYELVMTTSQLLSELIKRFWVLESNKAAPSDLYQQKSIVSDQISLLVFLKTWLREKPEDFEQNPELFKMLDKFLITIHLKLDTSLRFPAKSLRNTMDKIKQTINSQSSLSHNKIAETPSVVVYPGITEKTKIYFSQIHKEINLVSLNNIHELLMVIPPFEIAKQLCIFDLNLVSSIKLHHLKEGSKPKNGKQNAYLKSGLHFNHFTLFLIFLIIKVEKKAILLARLVSIANSLFELRNYQSFAIIMTALTHTFIFQNVNKVLQEVDRETYSLKHDLEALLDKKNGYRSFKRAINQASFPMVPFVPMIVQDYLRIDGYHQSLQKLPEEDKVSVNLDKMELIYETFENIFLTQFSSYDFDPIQIFQAFLEKYYKDVLYTFTGTTDTDDIEDILYKLTNPTPPPMPS